MQLVIAEKPSVAMSIAKVLGVKNRQNGYIEGNSYIISWCVGHLVGLVSPEIYDEKYKRWNIEDLPIFPFCLFFTPRTLAMLIATLGFSVITSCILPPLH